MSDTEKIKQLILSKYPDIKNLEVSFQNDAYTITADTTASLLEEVRAFILSEQPLYPKRNQEKEL